MKYVVEYTLPYVHVVRVGVTASSRELAIAKAEEAFSDCTIWDDTREIPLLEDDFEEVGGDTAVQFTARGLPKMAEACQR